MPSPSTSKVNKAAPDPLRGEGSSDAFSSTRHSNRSPVDNMEFFSRDDSPYVKPSNENKKQSPRWWKPNLGLSPERGMLKPAALMSQSEHFLISNFDTIANLRVSR